MPIPPQQAALDAAIGGGAQSAPPSDDIPPMPEGGGTDPFGMIIDLLQAGKVDEALQLLTQLKEMMGGEEPAVPAEASLPPGA